MKSCHLLVAALIACAGTASTAFAQPAGVAGPNAGAPSYMIPSAPGSGVQFISIATVLANQFYKNLDTGVNDYRMVGIPDGMGAYLDADDLASRADSDPTNDTFTVLMNHELGANAGIVRAHGSRGAFVSQWKVKTDFTVVGGRDLATSVNLFNMTTNTFQNFNSGSPMPAYAQGGALGAQGWDFASANFTSRNGIGRLCSADLAPVSAYSYTDPTGNVFGTTERIFMNGEEIGASGRAFAFIATGNEARQAYELPDLADFSWENAVASPYSQRKTVVASTDDSTPGQVYVYVGDKQATGNAVEKAGLMGGKTYGISVTSLVGNTTNPELATSNLQNAPFTLKDLSADQRGTGANFQTVSNTSGVTNFGRPEDGAWNPSNPNQFIFVTTGANVGGVAGSVPTRIYAADFADITNPTAGGTISMLGQGNSQGTFAGGFTSATGATTANSFDNIAVSRFNQVLIQEDVGGNDRLGRLWLYDIVADSMLEIGISDSHYFTPGLAGGNFLTNDEETSGIIDAYDILGPGWWLLNMQAHRGLGGELVEDGQMMAVFIPQTVPTPGALALLGLGGLAAARRRRR